MQLRDEADRKSGLVSKGKFGVLEKIEFGFLKFSPRPIGASELFLQMNRGKTEIIDLPVAQNVNPPEDPSVFSIRTYLLGTNQVFEQNGMRISFIGWFAPPSTKIPITTSAEKIIITPGADDVETRKQATSTPFIITPLDTNLPKGVTVTDQATLQIEDKSGQLKYVYVQFLSDGEVIGTLID